MDFKKLFQKHCMTIPFPTSFLTCFYLYQVRLKSCVRLGTRAWLFARLVIPCFHLPSNIFSSLLWTKLSLPHTLTLGLTHYIRGQSLNPTGIHFLCCAHGGERIASHDAIRDFFCPLREAQGFMSRGNKPTFFHRLLFNLLVDGLTLFYQLMAFTHWSMSFKQTWYHE